jgi:signal peptidase I
MENVRRHYTQRVYEAVKEITLLLLIVFMIRTFVFGLYQVPSGSMETTMLVGERFFGEKWSYFFRAPRVGEVIAFNDPTYPYASNYIMRSFQRYVWGPENWTKRVIGVPGDHMQGVIEYGRPVIYRNGEKMDQPYVNDLPLVYVLPADEQTVRNQIIEDIAQTFPMNVYSADGIQRLAHYMVKEYATPKTFDPACSVEEQPFYRMEASRLLKDAQGNIIYEGPHTPLENHGMHGSTLNEKQRFNGTDEFDVYLGANEYWLMGDNRLGSTDSRYYGPIQGECIHGRIVFRIWSIDSNASWWITDIVRDPLRFWTRIRWNRFFQIIT